MITVKLFASIREQLGVSELQWSAPTLSVMDLVAALARERGENWRQVLLAPQIIVAINQHIVDRNSDLQAGDEVAFFPPVTGG